MGTIRFEEQCLFKEIEAFGLLKGLSENVVNTLRPFADCLDLTVCDYLSIRDLAGFAGRADDPALAVVLMALFSTLEEGSLCLNLDPGKFAARFPSPLQEISGALINDFLQHLRTGIYKEIMDGNSGQFLPLVVDTRGGNSLLYFQKFHTHESDLKGLVERFLSSESETSLPPARIEKIIETLYAPALAIRVGKNHEPLAKDPIQLNAIRLSLQNQFSIISGGPGTGKTSLMVNILRALVRCGTDPARIILGAPTGRAAQRMTEALRSNLASIASPACEDSMLKNLSGATLHKILKYNGHRHDFHYKASNPLSASVVILDEVSMVDLIMMEKFLQAVDPSITRMIFLGDKDQLPSVEAGSVFAEMIPDGTRAEKFRDRLVILEKVYRSGTNLLNLARTINGGDAPDMVPVSMETALAKASDQWAFINADSPETLPATLKTWANAYYLRPLLKGEHSFRKWVRDTGESLDLSETDAGKTLLGRLFEVVEHARILTLIRNGGHGCNGINALIGQFLSRDLDPTADIRGTCFSGELIMITRNDYSKDLFNGDVGIILKDAAGLYRAYFKRSEAFIDFPVDRLPAWEPAFAMTVHKSQGSEFEDVLLVLPDDREHRMLTREIVYTGITRARNRVTLYGTPQGMKTALSRRIERQSGLGW
ncbi:MAG: exodeoxyribonuclease V subunit alpha [Pseudomonadota bacterium]